jgi:hypothetical protein
LIQHLFRQYKPDYKEKKMALAKKQGLLDQQRDLTPKELEEQILLDFDSRKDI